MVKCTTCGNRWRAFQDRTLAEGEAPEREPVADAPRPAPVPDDVEIVAPPVVPKSKPAPKPKAKTPVGLIVGVSLIAVLGLAAGGVILFRQQVAGLVPATAPAFAAIGLPVNTLGLVIEAKSRPMLQGGRPIWSVTGSIRNVNKTPTEAPPMRFSLLDKEGKPLAALLAQPLNAKIPPGATRYFAVSLPDPPAGAHALDIVFEPGAKAETPKAEAHAAPAHAAPAPVEAEPLPADSPDALKTHEQH